MLSSVLTQQKVQLVCYSMQRPDLSLFFPKHGLKTMDEKWNCSPQPPGEAIRVVWVELGLIEVTRNLYAGLLGRIIHLSYKVNSFLTTAVIGTEKLLFFFFLDKHVQKKYEGKLCFAPSWRRPARSISVEPLSCSCYRKLVTCVSSSCTSSSQKFLSKPMCCPS